MQEVKLDPATAAGILLAVLLPATPADGQMPVDLETASREAPACELSSIGLDDSDGETLIELSTSGNPKALEAKIARGGSFLLDLVGCVPGPELSGRAFPTGLVASLELVERSKDGEPMTAVAARTRGRFQYAVRSSPNRVLVRLQPAGDPGPTTSPRVLVMEPLGDTAAAGEPPGATAGSGDTAGPAAVGPAESRPTAGSAVDRLLEGARLSVTRSPVYDPTYRVIAYPDGDPGWQRGSGTDLVVRAYRHLGVDLQQRLHDDVSADAAAYGIHEPDVNVDHRRVRNLIVFFGRHGEALGLGSEADWRAGNVVFWATEGDRPNHVGIVTDHRTADGWPLVVHHAKGRTPAEEDVLFAWPVRGHFRWLPGR